MVLGARLGWRDARRSRLAAAPLAEAIGGARGALLRAAAAPLARRALRRAAAAHAPGRGGLEGEQGVRVSFVYLFLVANAIIVPTNALIHVDCHSDHCLSVHSSCL